MILCNGRFSIASGTLSLKGGFTATDILAWEGDSISAAIGDHHTFFIDANGYLTLEPIGGIQLSSATEDGAASFVSGSGLIFLYDQDDFDLGGAIGLANSGMRRKARDGRLYNLQGFKSWYGDGIGDYRWSQAERNPKEIRLADLLEDMASARTGAT